MLDYHIHTKRCGHATGEMHEYVEQAQAIGLSEMGFSDHFPFQDRERPELAMSLAELPDYVRDVEQIRHRYPKIPIRLGTEVDYFPQQEQQIGKLLAQYPFDYVIVGVHFIGEWNFDNRAEIAEWEKRDVNEVYEQYILLLKHAACSGLFNIVAHCDLVKIFGYRPTRSFHDQWEELVQCFAQNGLAVEISTAGLYKPVGEIYPSEEIIALLKKYNVPIVISSDAHRPEHVGRDFDRAIRLALKYGIDSVCLFENRKLVQQIPIAQHLASLSE
ncbi:MAG: histidinol-phosphatase HisJ family protein [candidate division KSB1 bacterium]|nr:histidinol-phosphatase HisJ family protein [candidate division KSB1 bacterium]MDZ7356154.1 histidinol-phosphatase HisJ family protein [candidate division KSB1 bacterium]MDZ7398868.1 histidinol-phosphatase HisJ family protein [candidate division KSB1 bacterium]